MYSLFKIPEYLQHFYKMFICILNLFLIFLLINKKFSDITFLLNIENQIKLIIHIVYFKSVPTYLSDMQTAAYA